MSALTASSKHNSRDDATRRHLLEYLWIASVWAQLGVPLPRIARLLMGLVRATDG